MPRLDDLRLSLGSAAEGRTDEDLLSLVSKATGRPMGQVADEYGYDPGKGSMWGERMSASVDRYQAGLYDVGSQVAGAVGLKNWSAALDERRRANEVQAGVAATRASNLGGIDSFRDVHGVGDFANYAGGLAVQSLPYVGEALVGGMAGRAAVAGARGFGSVVGATAASYPSSVGDILSNQREQAGTTDLGNAALLGVPYAGLNAFGVEGLAARASLARSGVQALDALKGAPGVLARTGATVARTGVTEGLSETGQEAINQMGRIAVDPSATLTDPEALERYKESFIGGATLGGVVGGAAGGWRRSEGYRPTIDETGNLLDPSNPVVPGPQGAAPPPAQPLAPLDPSMVGATPEVLAPPPAPPAEPVTVQGVDAGAVAARAQELVQERQAAVAELQAIMPGAKPQGGQISAFLSARRNRSLFNNEEFSELAAQIAAGDVKLANAEIKQRLKAQTKEAPDVSGGTVPGAGAGEGLAGGGTDVQGGVGSAGLAAGGQPGSGLFVPLAPAAPGATSLPARVAAVQQPAAVAPAESAPLTKTAPEGAVATAPAPQVTVKKPRKITKARDAVEAAKAENPEDPKAALRARMAQMSGKRRAIALDAMGMDAEGHEVGQPLPYDDVAKKHGVSRQYVQQVLGSVGIDEKVIERVTAVEAPAVGLGELVGGAEEGGPTGVRTMDRPNEADDFHEEKTPEQKKLEAEANKLLAGAGVALPAPEKLAVPGSRTEAFLRKKAEEKAAAKNAADEAIEARRQAYAAKLREDAQRLNKDVLTEDQDNTPAFEQADREGAERDWTDSRHADDAQWSELTQEEKDAYTQLYKSDYDGKLGERGRDYLDDLFDRTSRAAKARRAAETAPAAVVGDGSKSTATVTVKKKRSIQLNILRDPKRQAELARRAMDRAIRRSEGAPVSSQRISVRARINKALEGMDAGRLSEGELAAEMERLSEDLESQALDRKFAPKARERGADYVRERILQAKRRGDISEDAADFAEWFILQNPRLLDDLGVSVRKGGGAVAGNYDPVRRVMTLMKEADNDQTVVHEILHHLERMMPADLQDEVRSVWHKAIAAEIKRAHKKGDAKALAFLNKALLANLTTSEAAMRQASDMVAKGDVPYDYYGYLNPSEFWAVNMSGMAQARFDARNSMWEKTKLWLKEALEWMKLVLGLNSRTPMYRALREVMASNGEFQSSEMLMENGEYNIYAGPKSDISALERKRLKEAEKMLAQGMDAQLVRIATGWFKGPHDGKWRNEITDKFAKWRQDPSTLKESKVLGETYTYKLGDVLDHAQLYDKYPAAKDINFVVRAGFLDGGRLQGSFDPNTNTLQVTPYAQDKLSTAIHELQHWVQEREGFATGGNENSVMEAVTPEQLQRQAEKVHAKEKAKLDEAAEALEQVKRAREFPQHVETVRQASQAFYAAAQAHPEPGHPERAATYKRMNAAVDALRTALFGTSDYFKLTPAQRGVEIALKDGVEAAITRAQEKYTKVQKTMAALTSGDPDAMRKAIKDAGQAHELYTNIAGEIEARDTQARLKMSSDERRGTVPFSSETIDPRDVIVTYGGGGEQLSTQGPNDVAGNQPTGDQPGSARTGRSDAGVQAKVPARAAAGQGSNGGRVPPGTAVGPAAGSPRGGQEPAGLGELPPPPGRPAKLKGWLDSIMAGKWRAAPWLLGALSTEQLAERMSRVLSPRAGAALRTFHQGMQRMAQRANTLITSSDRIKRQWETLRSRHGAKVDEQFMDFMIESTRAGVFAMHPLDENGPNKHLGKIVEDKQGNKSRVYPETVKIQHAQLAQQWAKLPLEYRAFFDTLQKDFQVKYQAKVEGFRQNIVSGHFPQVGATSGPTKAQVEQAARIPKKDRAAFRRANVRSKLDLDTYRSLWNDLDAHATEFPAQLQGPYFPLMRFGEHIVSVKSQAYVDAETKLAGLNAEVDALLSDQSYAAIDKLELERDDIERKLPKAKTDAEKLELRSRLITLGKELEKLHEPIEAKRSERNKARTALSKLKGSSADYNVEFFESLGEATARKEQLAKHFAGREDVRVAYHLKDQYLREVDGVTPTFIKKVEERLGADLPASDKARVRQTMRELYLQMLPETSAMKSQMRRQNVAGVRADQGLRSFAASSVRDAWYISRLENRTPVQDALNELRFSDTSTDAKLVGNELAKRIAQNWHFDNHQWMSMATNVTYLAYLGMSPAFIVTQVTQPWVISAPVMAARHGAATAGQLWRGWKQAAQVMKVNGKNDGLNYTFDPKAGQAAGILTEGEAGMLQEMLDSGRIDITVTHDLGASAAGRSEGYLGKAVAMSAWPAQQAEILNRVSTALAAYRMEKAKLMKDGVAEEAATRAARDYADRIVAETHLNYAPENKARFMHPNSFGGWGRMMWQFRSYQQGMLYLVFKNLWDGIKGDKEAARSFVYLAGMQLAVAGTSGLPIAFPAGLAATLLYKMFTDDDDEKDLKELYFQSIASVAGDTAATAVVKGLPAAFLGVDMSKRLGMGSIMNPVPYADDRKEGRDMVAAYWIAMTGGAPLGYAANVAEGIKAAGQGDYAKAFAFAFPWKVAADLARGGSQAMNGMVDSKGNTILSPEELGLEDALTKMLGFPSTQVERTREQRNAFFEARQNRADGRQAVMRELVQSRLKGEPLDTQAMLDFNERHPDNRITMSDVLRQVKAKRDEQRVMQRTGGIPVKKADRALATELGIDAGR